MRLDDNLLLAYVDGELDAETAREVEAGLAVDEEARRTVSLFRESSVVLRTALNDTVHEPVPARLTETLLQSRSQNSKRVQSMPTRNAMSGWQPFYALAASIALLAVGFGSGIYVTEMRTEWRAQVERIAVNSGPKLAPAELPRYAVGETFIFSDGRRETVLNTKGEAVTWRDHYGNTITRYKNFLIPPLSWESRTRKSTAVTDASPKWLWPLAVGRDGEFDFRQAIERKNGGSGKKPASRRELARSWRCSVDQTEKVQVVAGTFDAYRVSCFRFRLGTDEWRQTRTYYYAPAVGHYIMQEDHFADRPSRRIELVSHGFNSTVLPKSDQKTLNKTLQDVLSRNPDDVGTVWKSAARDLAVTLTPIRTYKDKSGAACRVYSSAYDLGDRMRTNFRDVCHGGDGFWKRVRR